MSTQAWYEQFRDKLQGLTEVFEQSGTSLSLLGYALKEKQITSAEYLAWAMAHYKLPQLQARFFTETPPSQEMFAKWATHYPWSVECLPVAEWDGALIVACLQPPQDFPHSPACVLVLAPPEQIEATWMKWHQKAATEKVLQPPVIASAEVPEGIDLSLATSTKSAASDSFSFDDLENNSEESHAEDSEIIVADKDSVNLEGIFDNFTVTKLEKTVIDESPAADAPVIAAQEKVAIPVTAPVEVSAKNESLLKPILTPNAAPGGLRLPDGSAPAAVSATAGTPPPAPVTKEALPEESFTNKPIPIVARPAGVARPTMNPVANGNFSLEKLKKKNAILIADKVKKILSEMKSHFEKSMILTLDEQETQVTAFAWDENFQGIKDTSLRVPLKTASIFNVVASTQKPFHGYISLNEINEKFFDAWNQGRIPDHVTISPIMLNDKLIGMLVGFAEKSAYNKVSLNLAEKLSGEFIKGLAA